MDLVRRKLSLGESELGVLLNLPKGVYITAVQSTTDPVRVEIVLSAELDEAPWSPSVYDGFVNAESEILSFQKWYQQWLTPPEIPANVGS